MSLIPRSVDIKSFPSRTVAYICHVGSYAGDVRLFDRLIGTLMAWARPKGLVIPMQTELITVYNDDSQVSTAENPRISVGLTVPPGTCCEDGVEIMEIPAGDYFCTVFEIDRQQYEGAWDHVRDVLMPDRNLQRGTGPCYECYLNDPSLHPQGKHRVEIRISIGSRQAR